MYGETTLDALATPRIATWDEDDPLSHPFSGSPNAEICSFCYMARSSHFDADAFTRDAT